MSRIEQAVQQNQQQQEQLLRHVEQQDRQLQQQHGQLQQQQLVLQQQQGQLEFHEAVGQALVGTTALARLQNQAQTELNQARQVPGGFIEETNDTEVEASGDELEQPNS